MKRVIRLIYDPKEETKEAFDARVAEAIGDDREEDLIVLITEIVNWKRPTVDECGHA